jgi:hypothetical protein
MSPQPKTFHIVARFSTGQIMGQSVFTAHPDDTAYSILCHARNCYTWARGFIDDAGLLHRFNPHMTVDGVSVADVIAAHNASLDNDADRIAA